MHLAANFLNQREMSCCVCKSYFEWHKCIEEKTHIITSFQRFNNGAKNFWNGIFNFIKDSQIWMPLAGNFLNHRERSCCLCESCLEWLKGIEEKTHIITSFQRFKIGPKISKIVFSTLLKTHKYGCLWQPIFLTIQMLF